MTWSIATYRHRDTTGLAVLREDGSLVQAPELKRWSGMLDLLDDWSAAVDVLRTLDVQDVPQEHDALLAPINWPRKVVCAGVNYRRHIREMGGEVPGADWEPFFFLKPPTTTVIGPTDPIVLHSADTARYDWEAELAVVIGTGGRDIAVEDALKHVAGYSVSNDITARGQHKRDKVPADAFLYDWFASKAIDSSLPLGPGITPAFHVPDPQKLRLRSWVNDTLQQDESTGDMICTVAELISAASRIVTLEPGDVIPTGTPSGVGAGRGLFLRDGDVIRTSIDGLGTLVNPVFNAAGATS
ncbi:fumarylacetoacetate hydrolase family protein [Streptomyces sp. NPDC057199]|uniref:fumarylacetoacetate hydrolase family protein n=1 Tax=Streptomyces sp. NPDC057199 TaxID=3346047 RepID=UPI00363AA3D1